MYKINKYKCTYYWITQNTDFIKNVSPTYSQATLIQNNEK